jgi:hypothetical protein
MIKRLILSEILFTWRFIMTPYPSSVEKEMKKFFDSLSEKDKRHYAAIETLKLGHGGRKYISQILGCNRKTIRRGIR